MTSCLRPFLKMGVTFANLNCLGYIPVIRLRLRILVMLSAITSALNLRNLAESPSSPVDLDDDNVFNCSITKS